MMAEHRTFRGFRPSSRIPRIKALGHDPLQEQRRRNVEAYRARVQQGLPLFEQIRPKLSGRG